MDYWGSITVPASTSETNPIRESLPVCAGRVKEVWVYFPPGLAGTTKVRILHHEYQVWPTNPDTWYLGTNIVISFPENYPVFSAPFEFTLEGYNDSISYSHTVYFRLTVMLEEALAFSGPPTTIYRLL